MSVKPFYNTIKLNPTELQLENAKALGLQAHIEIIFKLFPSQEFSGWQMKHHLERLLEKKININSVRRSITNLKNENVLTKTEILVMGDEGKNEHLYRLTSKPIYKELPKYPQNLIQADLFNYTNDPFVNNSKT